MDAITIISLIASLASLVLAVIAIWMSMYFYNQSKNTEANVQIALEGIKSQTNTLQSLNARTLDRLTKYVTTPRNDASQTAQLLITALPDIVLKLMPPNPSSNEESLRKEIIHAYIAIWNYVAQTNVWASFCLPSPEDFDEDSAYDRHVSQIVDRSAADFTYMTDIIEKIHPDIIRTTAYANLYDEVQSQLRPMIGDTKQQFIKRIKQQRQHE